MLKIDETVLRSSHFCGFLDFTGLHRDFSPVALLSLPIFIRVYEKSAMISVL